MPSPRQPIRDYAIGYGPLYSHLATATREPLDVCSTELSNISLPEPAVELGQIVEVFRTQF
jgi:hypothetical protein